MSSRADKTPVLEAGDREGPGGGLAMFFCNSGAGDTDVLNVWKTEVTLTIWVLSLIHNVRNRNTIYPRDRFRQKQTQDAALRDTDF